MPVIGIGVDVCDVARMASMLRRTPAAAQRLFTDEELTAVGAGPARPARLAARFAAKEAVIKALGGSVPGMAWHDVRVVGVGVAPTLDLGGTAAGAAAERGVVTWHLSLSHDAGIAVAMVVAES